jgi:hypothetical protein
VNILSLSSIIDTLLCYNWLTVSNLLWVNCYNLVIALHVRWYMCVWGDDSPTWLRIGNLNIVSVSTQISSCSLAIVSDTTVVTTFLGSENSLVSLIWDVTSLTFFELRPPSESKIDAGVSWQITKLGVSFSSSIVLTVRLRSTNQLQLLVFLQSQLSKISHFT